MASLPRVRMHGRVQAEMYYDSGNMKFSLFTLHGQTLAPLPFATGVTVATIGPADEISGDFEYLHRTGEYLARFVAGGARVTYLSRDGGLTWSEI